LAGQEGDLEREGLCVFHELWRVAGVWVLRYEEDGHCDDEVLERLALYCTDARTHQSCPYTVLDFGKVGLLRTAMAARVQEARGRSCGPMVHRSSLGDSYCTARTFPVPAGKRMENGYVYVFPASSAGSFESGAGRTFIATSKRGALSRQ
jgi:hypothetical protein